MSGKENYLLLSTGVYRLSETYITGIKCHDCDYAKTVIVSKTHGMLWAEKHDCRRKEVLLRAVLRSFLRSRQRADQDVPQEAESSRDLGGDVPALIGPESPNAAPYGPIQRVDAPEPRTFPHSLWN